MISATEHVLQLVVCLMIPVALAIILTMVVVALRSRDTDRRREAGGAPRSPRPRGEQLPEEPADIIAELDANEVEAEHLPMVRDLPYERRRYLLTQAERDFFAVLRTVAPEGWHVFPQVRLANLVLLRKGTRNWKPHYSRVAQKCVDFVLCDGTEISPRLVVELDDSSHDRADRQRRDAFVDAALGAAGLPILHVRWQRRYDPDQLARQIAATAGLAVSTWPSATLASTASPQLGSAPSGPVYAARSALTTGAPVRRWACRTCGAEVGATAKHCSHCGARLEL